MLPNSGGTPPNGHCLLLNAKWPVTKRIAYFRSQDGKRVADGQHGGSVAIPPDNDASCFERHAYCIGSANSMLAAFRVIGLIRVGTASSIG